MNYVLNQLDIIQKVTFFGTSMVHVYIEKFVVTKVRLCLMGIMLQSFLRRRGKEDTESKRRETINGLIHRQIMRLGMRLCFYELLIIIC